MLFVRCPSEISCLLARPHARVSSGERGWAMEYMLRRGEGSWFYVKFEFAFFADHGIFTRVVPPSFLALSVNELCLLFWLLHSFFTRFHAFWPL